MKIYFYTIAIVIFVLSVIGIYKYVQDKMPATSIKDNYIKEENIVTQTTNEVTPYIDSGEPVINDDGYKVSWIVSRDKQNFHLYSNTSNKLTSGEAIIENNCKYLINAGFVDKSYNHIGLFKNHNGIISKYRRNNTFNGFLYVDNNRDTYITYNEPIDSLISLQSGPVLMKNNSPINLSLSRDENARRVIAAVNRKKEAIFIVFYSKNNPFIGPKLADLPSMLEELEENTSLNITDAINLDGGKHSVFIGDQINLIEASIVGGYFCIERQ